jgi:hypothetical protein
MRGYGSAVRSVLTAAGRPPLAASSLPLHDRLCTIAASLERGAHWWLKPRNASRARLPGKAIAPPPSAPFGGAPTASYQGPNKCAQSTNGKRIATPTPLIGTAKHRHYRDAIDKGGVAS